MARKRVIVLRRRWSPEQGDLLTVAREMLEAAENEGWHHCPVGTVEAVQYARVVNLVRALEARGDT